MGRSILYRLLLATVAGLLICSVQGNAQVLRNDDSLAEKQYLYKVKSIDEFIERFNDDQQSFLRQELKKQKKQQPVTRQQLLVHLFDAGRKDWNPVLVKKFLSDLFSPSAKYQISFTDSNWIAVAMCRFAMNGSQRYIPLKLRIKNTHPSGARWVICGVADSNILAGSIAEGFTRPQPEGFKFIPSSSHATGFIAFTDIFQDIANLPVYFDEEYLATGAADRFLKALADKTISFEHVDQLHYYFFQVDNWVFRVSDLERNTMNQGWLITELYKVPEAQKNNFFQSIDYLATN